MRVRPGFNNLAKVFEVPLDWARVPYGQGAARNPHVYPCGSFGRLRILAASSCAIARRGSGKPLVDISGDALKGFLRLIAKTSCEISSGARSSSKLHKTLANMIVFKWLGIVSKSRSNSL